MPVGVAGGDFNLLSSAPVNAIHCVSGPTPPRSPLSRQTEPWRLVKHLHMNYGELLHENPEAAAASLKQLLKLYVDETDAALVQQIDGIVAIETQPIVRRLQGVGRTTAGRGLEVRLIMDEDHFEGSGCFKLAKVLDDVLCRYASINSFIETVLVSAQRGPIKRWVMQVGRRQTL